MIFNQIFTTGLCRVFIATIFVIAILLVPAFTLVQAQGATGLVPCGTGPDDACKFEDFYKLLTKVFDFLVLMATSLAVLGIGIGGFRMMLGSASEGERTQGKEILTASIIGLIIVLASWLIIHTVLVGLGATGFNNPLK